MELALALLRVGSDRPATILVGRIPEEYSADVNVPRGARVLGSLVSGGQASVILMGPESTDSLRADIERTLLARGWTRFQPPYSDRGGFVTETPRRIAQFCKGTSRMVNVSTAAAREGTAQARLEFFPDRGMCDTSAVRVQREEMMMGTRGMTFPTLHAPPGSGDETVQACFSSRRSGSGSRSSMGTFFRTTMSPADLLAFYGAQLTAQGWKPALSRQSAAWTIRDSMGTSRTVVLSTSQAEGSSCSNVDMSLSVERN